MFLLYKFTRNYFLFSYTSDFDRRRLECCHVLRYQIVGRDQQSMGRHCNHLFHQSRRYWKLYPFSHTTKLFSCVICDWPFCVCSSMDHF